MERLADLPGHTDPAWCVAWNPRRPLLASCSGDRTVRIYAYHFSSPSPSSFSSQSQQESLLTPTFTYLTRIETTHKKTVRSIAWSPDGKVLVTGSFDATVGVWEEIPLSDDEDDDEQDGQHDEDDATSARGKPVQPRRRVREWECVTTLEGHDSECKAVAFSSDGALLASCSRDKSVWVWEVQPDTDFECISVMMEHTQDVKTIAWHPKDEILASASYDATILLYIDDPDDDWAPFQKLEPRLPAQKVDLASLLPSTTAPGTKEDQEEEFHVPELKEPETIWALAFSPCGQFLASGGDNGGIRVWARSGDQMTSRWVEVAHVQAHDPRSCFSLSWTGPSQAGKKTDMGHNDLGRIVSGGGDGKFIVWRIIRDSNETSSTPTISPVSAVSITPIHVQPNAHTIYDINSVQWCQRKYEDEEEVSEGGKVQLSEKERNRRAAEREMFATAGDDGSVKVWRSISN